MDKVIFGDNQFFGVDHLSEESSRAKMMRFRDPQAIIKVLDHAKSLGILEEVSDEGDFWQDRDVRALAQQVGQWNEMIAAFAGELKDLLGDQIESEITKFPDFEHLEAAGSSKE